MLSIKLASPNQIKKQIAARAKQKRLELNLSRKTLATKSSVPASTIKHFETYGDISLDALLRIALVLDCLGEFNELFNLKEPVSLYQPTSIRQRGRE